MSVSRDYQPSRIEKKWQEAWKKEGIYTPDISSSPKPFYNLWMFPYPSAEGLHAGHAFSSTGSDIYGRFQRMGGFDVFQPMGFDSFGIHSENFAIKIGEHPRDVVSRTTVNYRRQLESMGHGYDWTRSLVTSSPDYYKWTQWIFVRLFKAGLAYRKEAEVNWCPSCKTVLADEQVVDGKCERCDSQAEKRRLKQWFFRITDYADRLLENLEKIDWSRKIKTLQRNWIGRSEGMKINFEVEGSGDKIDVFTTRPDTLNGATFLVLSPDSEWVEKLTTGESRQSVRKYLSGVRGRDGKENHLRDKSGVFTGSYAVNPLTGAKIPVWVSDYVVAAYGSGAIMGVPAHDKRDMEFAGKFGIEIVKKAPDKSLSGRIAKEGWGEAFTNYHLRDWLISRQRYWGPPIPMVFCEACEKKNKGERKDMPGWYAVGEEELPVELPHVENYRPVGTGESPLAGEKDFFKTKCPGCGGEARRETDVSDTFLDSSWYFFRYPSVGLETKDKPWSEAVNEKWLPVDLYFGGAEHAVLHLMYARFISMVFKDLKLISRFEEPFPRFFAHGLMIKDGAKMSKSKGNVVNPDMYIEKFGADAFRMYLMFIGPMDGSPDFRDTGMEGMMRFVKRIWKLYGELGKKEISSKKQKDVAIKMHQTIKKVTENIQSFRYNSAIASVMEFLNVLEPSLKKGEENGSFRESLKTLTLILAPFAPHLAEEAWVEMLGEEFSVHKAQWPKWDPGQLQSGTVEVVIEVNGKVRGQLGLGTDQAQNEDFVLQEALKQENIAKWVKGLKTKKTVFVPGKLLNIVVG